MYEDRPWLKYYGSIPQTIDYPRVTLCEALMQTAASSPKNIAWDFFDTTCTYKKFAGEVGRCADGLAAMGLKKGDRITISMPTSPQAVICLYAANRLGAVANMIHPLSSDQEIEFFLKVSGSTMALTLDAYYGSFSRVMPATECRTLILARIQEYMPLVKRTAFNLTIGKWIQKVPHGAPVVWWRDMMKQRHPKAAAAETHTDDPAVILYSSGTTATPRPIVLSNFNLISQGMMTARWAGMDGRNPVVLATLPIFHGSGLGVCVNAAFMCGGMSILVPRFVSGDVARLIRKKRPGFIFGLPSLFEALITDPEFNSADLSCLKGCFCGSEPLPGLVRKEFEYIVKRQGGDVRLLEGYGLTEAVTGIMAMPMGAFRKGSIGIPLPDMLAKVVKPDTIEEVRAGEEGEICISGPAVMLGYLDRPVETATALCVHTDGRTWLHTGDLGVMDEDGFFYFRLRRNRIIRSDGMNVYPLQVEEVLRSHPYVSQACVIGVPDRDRKERVKAFVVVNDSSEAGPELEKAIKKHCMENLLRWSCPRDIEFRQDLPRTLVGKVAFNVLMEEERAKLRASGEYSGN